MKITLRNIKENKAITVKAIKQQGRCFKLSAAAFKRMRELSADPHVTVDRSNFNFTALAAAPGWIKLIGSEQFSADAWEVITDANMHVDGGVRLCDRCGQLHDGIYYNDSCAICDSCLED